MRCKKARRDTSGQEEGCLQKLKGVLGEMVESGEIKQENATKILQQVFSKEKPSRIQNERSDNLGLAEIGEPKRDYGFLSMLECALMLKEMLDEKHISLALIANKGLAELAVRYEFAREGSDGAIVKRKVVESVPYLPTKAELTKAREKAAAAHPQFSGKQLACLADEMAVGALLERSLPISPAELFGKVREVGLEGKLLELARKTLERWYPAEVLSEEAVEARAARILVECLFSSRMFALMAVARGRLEDIPELAKSAKRFGFWSPEEGALVKGIGPKRLPEVKDRFVDALCGVLADYPAAELSGLGVVVDQRMKRMEWEQRTGLSGPELLLEMEKEESKSFFNPYSPTRSPLGFALESKILKDLHREYDILPENALSEAVSAELVKLWAGLRARVRGKLVPAVKELLSDSEEKRREALKTVAEELQRLSEEAAMRRRLFEGCEEQMAALANRLIELYEQERARESDAESLLKKERGLLVADMAWKKDCTAALTALAWLDGANGKLISDATLQLVIEHVKKGAPFSPVFYYALHSSPERTERLLLPHLPELLQSSGDEGRYYCAKLMRLLLKERPKVFIPMLPKLVPLLKLPAGERYDQGYDAICEVIVAIASMDVCALPRPREVIDAIWYTKDRLDEYVRAAAEELGLDHELFDVLVSDLYWLKFSGFPNSEKVLKILLSDRDKLAKYMKMKKDGEVRKKLAKQVRRISMDGLNEAFAKYVKLRQEAHPWMKSIEATRAVIAATIQLTKQKDTRSDALLRLEEVVENRPRILGERVTDVLRNLDGSDENYLTACRIVRHVIDGGGKLPGETVALLLKGLKKRGEKARNEGNELVELLTKG